MSPTDKEFIQIEGDDVTLFDEQRVPRHYFRLIRDRGEGSGLRVARVFNEVSGYWKISYEIPTAMGLWKGRIITVEEDVPDAELAYEEVHDG